MKKRRKRRGVASKRERAGWMFVMPFVLGLAFIFLPSFIETVLYSFNKIVISPSGYTLEFRGLDYYRYMLLEHSSYNQQFVQTIIKMARHVPLVLVFSLFMAVVLSGKFRGQGLMLMIIFMPVITSSGVLASLNDSQLKGNLLVTASSSELAGQMQMSSTWLLDSLGLTGSLKSYFSNALSSIYTVITSSGVQILIFIAAIKSIPDSVYESVKMEGATGWEAFWKITFPMVSPYILTNSVYTVVSALSFETNPVLELVETTAKTGNTDLSLSAAMALLFCLAELLFLGVVVFIVSRLVFYYD